MPAYDRAKVRPGVLHIGSGNFHRAHQAVYTDDILREDPRWGIVGASLHSMQTRDRLKPQDFLYTVCERSGDMASHRVIGSIIDICCLTDQRQRLLRQFVSDDIKVVTLTITEKGYCQSEDGHLDVAHPDIQHDLAHPDLCRSAPGVLMSGLKDRMASGAGPLTLVSCDNLSGNGSALKQVVLDFAGLVDANLMRWCEENLAFPDTMVDRIVPQPIDEDRLAFRQAFSLSDEGLLVCEPFRQWVIEDNFISERPPWDHAGVQFVQDVSEFESIKLRMLNATHSALAYLGLLCGYATIHETMSDPLLSGFAKYLMDREVIPLIAAPEGMDLSQYRDDILSRFANPAIAYGTAQVANDGSKKLPQRIYPTLRQATQAGGVYEGLSLVVAAWLACLSNPELKDKFADPLRVVTDREQLLDATGLKMAIALPELTPANVRHLISGIIARR